MSQNVGQPKVNLTPSSLKRHRQAADAKWRANMNICFAMLKYAKKDVAIPIKKIPRNVALRTAFDQLPRIEDTLARLLAAKNHRFGTSEKIEDVHNDFRSLSALSHHQVTSAKRSQVKDQSCTAVNCSSQGHTASYLADMPRSSSRASGHKSWTSESSYQTCSPEDYSHSNYKLEDNAVFIDGNKTSDDEFEGYFDLFEVTPSGQVVPSSHDGLQQRIDDGTLPDGNLDKTINRAEEFIDLEEYQKMLFAPTGMKRKLDDTPLARSRSPAEMLLLRSPKCRRLFEDRDTIMSTAMQTVSRQQVTEMPKNTDNVFVPGYDSDADSLVDASAFLEFYGESPTRQGPLMRSEVDPMVSVDKHVLTIKKPIKQEPAEIVSPWKLEDVQLESYNILNTGDE